MLNRVSPESRHNLRKFKSQTAFCKILIIYAKNCDLFHQKVKHIRKNKKTVRAMSDIPRDPQWIKHLKSVKDAKEKLLTKVRKSTIVKIFEDNS